MAAQWKSVWIPAARSSVPGDAEPVIGRAFARPVGIAGRTLHRVRYTMIATPLEAYSIRRHIAGNMKRGGL
ncbi:hypothetical protein [Bradyrhizobium sp.]|jgi:hypothetical protein|uniref:hypothetical protein n=1 Tax=Bradyrhizobium sp. TaxID=376 RepID=UPI003C277697